MLEKRLGGSVKSILASLGVLLMLASFIWWQILSTPRSAISTRRSSAPSPFTLVVLDPGHGGQDSGAMCGAIAEKDLTLNIAQRVDRLLQAQGLATLMTRIGDSYVSLQDRAAVTNRARNCIFVSIHFNESKKVVSGVETYYAEHQDTPAPRLVSWIPFFQDSAAENPTLASQSLARFIQEAMVARTRAVDRGTKAEQFFVIAHVDVPAVLVEGGFLNKEDIVKLESNDYRDQMAAAISEGILRYRDVLKERQLSLAVTDQRPE
ncbi:MAG TPA: N-acetylmuramoyl-L-alanine amidase [Chthoniobacterales bacterium]|jgi:N-acetylmuramoyl-L-alanine amidase|nr:N-acetylmuramoyl-L-alanine amidase [Chthoniobacterales bacterium]